MQNNKDMKHKKHTKAFEVKLITYIYRQTETVSTKTDTIVYLFLVISNASQLHSVFFVCPLSELNNIYLTLQYNK